MPPVRALPIPKRQVRARLHSKRMLRIANARMWINCEPARYRPDSLNTRCSVANC